MSVRNAFRNPRAYLGGRWETYTTLLFDPETFFDDLGEAGLKKELVLVLVIGAVGAAGPYYAFQRLLGPFCMDLNCGPNDPTLTAEAPFRLRGVVLKPVLVAVGIWIGFTVAFYALSWLYNERGSVRSVLKITAWGMVPLFFANLIRSIGYAVAAWGVDVEGDLQSNPDAWFARVDGFVLTSQQVEVFWGQVVEDPAVVVASLLALAFLVWAGYVWGHGLAEVRYIEPEEAYRVVAVPSAVYALYVAVTVASELL